MIMKDKILNLKEKSYNFGDAISKFLLKKLLFFFSLAYFTALYGANLLWYKHHDFSNFHWFDDLAEWQQMDKLGHIFTAFHLSSFAFIFLSFVQTRLFLPRLEQIKNSSFIIFLSASIGFLLLSSIEILDGFSVAYGASVYDLIANLLGSFIFAFQRLFFQKIVLQPKFSFHFSDFATQRPSVLGDSWLAQFLKDYNGQTYWYSVNVYQLFYLMAKKTPFGQVTQLLDLSLTIPKDKFQFISLAFGFSASNMVFGRDFQNEQVGIIPFRRYFISLDIDLPTLKSQYRFINSLGFLANLLHLPLPALEWNERDGFVWHWIYF
jgi:hypothetical protein